MGDMNLETITDIQSWCRTWPPNGSRHIRARPRLHKKPREACKSSWSPKGILKSFKLTNSLEFGKACEDLSWSHCTSTPHRSETNGIADRAVRRVKEGTSAVLLQSGLNESWWADSMDVTPIFETSQIYYLMGRRSVKDVLGNHLKDLLFHLVHLLSITLYLQRTTSQESINLERVLPGLFLGYALYAGGNLEG